MILFTAKYSHELFTARYFSVIMNIERSESVEKERKKSSFATAGFVVGIVGIALSFIPIINNISFILGVLAVIFGVIALIKKASKGKAVTAIILGVLAIVITVSLQSSWAKAIDETVDEMGNGIDDFTGENTEEILKKNVQVDFGSFYAVTDEYGLTDSKLTVTVTNKSDKSKSFSVQVEAVDSSGKRIDTDTIYVNSLASGQSQDVDAFTYVNSDKIDAMNSATFKVVEVSMY